MKRTEEPFQGNHCKRPPSPPAPPARKTHYIVSRLAENHPPANKNEALSPATIPEPEKLEMEAKQRTPLLTKQKVLHGIIYTLTRLLLAYGLFIDPQMVYDIQAFLYEIVESHR